MNETPKSRIESRAPSAGSLENAWIEVFRAGDYGERGNWTAGDLDRLAASYDARLHAAPVVLGHPGDDSPAYGWVKRLRRAGESLWAQLEKVDPALEALVRAGRFAQRSVALYKKFPLTGGPYLRHVGFLGAAPPAVKALSPVRLAPAEFQEIDAGTFPLASIPTLPEAAMPESKSKLESFLDHLRGFFVPAVHLPSATPTGEGSADPSPVPSSSTELLAERLAALEQRLDAVAEAKDAAEQKLNETEATRRQEQVANFVESLRSRGRFPPLFDRWGVQEFMERLAQAEGTAKNACPAGEESAGEPQSTLLEWFQEFLAKLPAVIEFRELSSKTSHESRVMSHGSRLVRFTEPQRGMSVDPESVELAERAEALAVEENISYAEALAQLREEGRQRNPVA
ncbi:MAG TPA: hypothetical protein VNN18_06800 [Candidatus Xenobia bacterium]|nr:hypothetical protein [Candidatus Xenobia bacterium]